MNRHALCQHVMRMKDAGYREIFVIIDGKKYPVPTAHSGEGTTTVSSLMDSHTDNGAVLTERYPPNV